MGTLKLLYHDKLKFERLGQQCWSANYICPEVRASVFLFIYLQSTHCTHTLYLYIVMQQSYFSFSSRVRPL